LRILRFQAWVASIVGKLFTVYGTTYVPSKYFLYIIYVCPVHTHDVCSTTLLPFFIENKLIFFI
jgi:hypothetical protein